MSKHHKRLILFAATFVSLGSLVASFGGNLNAYKIYQTTDTTLFGEIKSYHIITDRDTSHPFGFSPTKAVLVDQRLTHHFYVKCSFLAVSMLVSAFLLFIDPDVLEDLELDVEIQDIRREGKKEIAKAAIKQRLAMKSKAQQLLFLDEMKALIDLGEEQYKEETQAEDALESKQLSAIGFIQDGYELETAVAMAWNLDRTDSKFPEVLQNFKQWLEVTEDA